MSAFIEVDKLSKNYQMGEIQVHAAQNMSFQVDEGEFVVILGPSGSGKSTLLNILGGMDKPSSGSILVSGQRVDEMTENELTTYRRRSIGFVFQFYNLMPNLTALENVTLVTEIAEKAFDPVETLKQVGLGDRLHNFPSQLSGGEQQRVAIARALVKNPDLLLCDEPTGALDYETGIQVLKSLQEANQRLNKTLIVITHNAAIAQMANKVIHVQSGHISDIHINENPLPPERIEW
jgi:putative ABC transport system ATP-binding protein